MSSRKRMMDEDDHYLESKKERRFDVDEKAGIEDHVYQYYIQMSEELKANNDLEKDSLVDQFFRMVEVDDKNGLFPTNPRLSKILEEFLLVASMENILTVMNALSEDLRRYSVDPFASHVLQTLLIVGLKQIQAKQLVTEQDTSKVNMEDLKKQITEFLLKTAKFVCNNLDEFINDVHASHVVRTVLEVCSGMDIKACKQNKSTHSLQNWIDNDQLLEVPECLSSIAAQFFLRVRQLTRFEELVCFECSSAVLQSILIVAAADKNRDSISIIVDHVITYGFLKLDEDCADNLNITHMLFQYKAAVHLLEGVIVSASEIQQKQIYEKFFKHTITHIIPHRYGNYALQKLLTQWKDSEEFTEIYENVINCCCDISAANIGAVLNSLIQACKKLKTHQTQVLQHMMKLLDCEDEEHQKSIVPLLLFYLTREEFESKRPFETHHSISLQGTLILQRLLQFSKPIKVVRSLLSMLSNEIELMACDIHGCHVVDAFLNGSFIGEKKKEKFIRKFQGCLGRLASCKYGSRSLEALWNKASIPGRTKICEELVQEEKSWKYNSFGKIIYNNFKLKLFKKSDKSDWQELQLKEERRIQKFEDLLNTEDLPFGDKSFKKRKREKNYSNPEKN